ncbi:MAG: hypothetical protein WC491_07475, partial [Candidatus Omnitrophota bacterium]
ASFKGGCEKVERALSRREKLKPSEIYDCLEGYPHEVLLMFIAKSGSQTVKRRIMAFMVKYSEIKLHLRGEDLKRAGIKPGPHFRDMMKRALHAKLDGKIKTKPEELDYAVRHYRQQG